MAVIQMPLNESSVLYCQGWWGDKGTVGVLHLPYLAAFDAARDPGTVDKGKDRLAAELCTCDSAASFRKPTLATST